jgi:hypothetical protein
MDPLSIQGVTYTDIYVWGILLLNSKSTCLSAFLIHVSINKFFLGKLFDIELK